MVYHTDSNSWARWIPPVAMGDKLKAVVQVLEEGDCVVDATCGNGFDTLHAARHVGSSGLIHAFDIQVGWGAGFFFFACVYSRSLLRCFECLVTTMPQHEAMLIFRSISVAQFDVLLSRRVPI